MRPSLSRENETMYGLLTIVLSVCAMVPSDPMGPSAAPKVPVWAYTPVLTEVKPVFPDRVHPAKVPVSNPPLTTRFGPPGGGGGGGGGVTGGGVTGGAATICGGEMPRSWPLTIGVLVIEITGAKVGLGLGVGGVSGGSATVPVFTN